MIKVLLFFLSVISASAEARLLPAKDGWDCGGTIEKTMGQLAIKLRGDWKRNSHSSSLPVYSIATSKVAEWVILEKTFEGKEGLSLTSEEKVTRYEFSPDAGCGSSIKISQLKKSTRGMASLEWFDDQALKELLKKSPDGILFIWSPHMRLSLISVSEIKKAASEIGLPVAFLLDPMADQKTAKLEAETYKIGDGALRRVDSVELSMRNSLVHFPTLIVTRNGKICEKVQRGYRKSVKFQAIIADIYGACK